MYIAPGAVFSNRIFLLFMGIATFLKGVRTELTHVKWPTRAQTIASVVFVIVAAFLVAYYLGLLDFAFKALLKLIVR